MKTKILPILVLTGALLVTGCGGGKKSSSNSSVSNSSIGDSSVVDSTSSNGSQTTSTYNDDDEEYTISVSETTGVTYQLSKNKAKKGENVTIQLTFAEGFSLKTITSTAVKLNDEGNNKYSFVMPNRSVRIVITVNITGDVVITGQIAAKMTEEKPGIFVARNVVASNSAATCGFDLTVKGKKINSMDLDESRCFAYVETTSGTGNQYGFIVGSGCTYDFYYDTTSEFPFYVVRTSVDRLPTDGDGIYALFEGRMRSEPTCHPTNLVGIDYTYQSETLSYDSHYKKYANNTSFTYVNDVTVPTEPQQYYVYKSADFEKNVYTVVNTWEKAKGNNDNEYHLWALDPNKGEGEGNNHKEFSAKLDIVPEEEYGNKYSISVREANRDIAEGAHYGAELEYEVWNMYRELYDGNVYINAPQNWDWKQETVVDQATGNFTITVDSYLEYNYDASESTADVTAHEGYVNHLVFGFLKNGALKTLSAKKSFYNKNQWNFSTHKPLNASVGSFTTITVNNTFGNEYTGKPEFDPSKYFISSINAIIWESKQVGKTSNGATSYVNFNDLLDIYPYGNGGKKGEVCKTFDFSPSTALDKWQYTVVASDNENVVAKNGQNNYQAVGCGEANVTIGNNTNNSNKVTAKTKVVSSANGVHHGFYINALVSGYDSYRCSDSTTIDGVAGRRLTYYIETSSYNTGAPCEYTLMFRTVNQFDDYVYSETSEYVNVITTGHVLTLDFNTEKSNALTKTYSLSVKFMSDYYEENWPITTMTINIAPKQNNEQYIGSKWIYDSYVSNNKPVDDYTELELTNEKVSGYATDTYKGRITDVMIRDGQLISTDVWEFIYQITPAGNFLCEVTSVSLESKDLPKQASAYNLEIGGVQNDLLLVAMYWATSDMSGMDYDDIFGVTTYLDEYGFTVEGYQGFSRDVR